MNTLTSYIYVSLRSEKLIAKIYFSFLSAASSRIKLKLVILCKMSGISIFQSFEKENEILFKRYVFIKICQVCIIAFFENHVEIKKMMN